MRLAAVGANPCLKCGHSYVAHIPTQVPWKFGGQDSGFEPKEDFKIIGCTLCQCTHPRFRALKGSKA